MPDLRMPDLSGRTLMAIVVVMAGIVAMLVALLSSSSSPTSDNPRQSSNRSKAIEPVAPINPEDVEPRPASTGKPVNPTDPFAISFGKSARRDVTVRVTGNGFVNMSESYRNDKKGSQRVVNGSYSATRTFKSRYPMATVAVQIPAQLPGSASRATCTIAIDGIEVAKQTIDRPGYLVFCVG